MPSCNAHRFHPELRPFVASRANPSQVQELKQGFELRYDLVLSVSHKGSGGTLVLGPPPPEDVTLAALKAAKKSLEQVHVRQADAAVFIPCASDGQKRKPARSWRHNG